MEPYTLDRNFAKQQAIDGFNSFIWTERYYGDGEVELVVPITEDNVRILPVGTFLSIDESDEVMILETLNIEEGQLKLKGISQLAWLNNRFIRSSSRHQDRYWYTNKYAPGKLLWQIIYNWCVSNSMYMGGQAGMGIYDFGRNFSSRDLAIPGLVLKDFDPSGSIINAAVPYGPLYDAMREIATTYEIGMQLLLDTTTTSYEPYYGVTTPYTLGFRSYKGLDRTSNQTDFPIVRFSPHMDSFTNIKELQSIAGMKTVVFAFAPTIDPAVINTNTLASGFAIVPGQPLPPGTLNGFELRALCLFAEDISSDSSSGVMGLTGLKSVLNTRAKDALAANSLVQAVDGEIVPTSQFKYGIDYNLGDIIEVEGNTGVVQTARITEYIRAQDEAGERGYPTVAMIG